MAAPTITDLPEVPPTNDADFETKAPALFNAIKNTFVGEVNDFGDYLNTTDWLTLALGLSANKLTYSDGTGDVVVAPELNWDSVNKRLGISGIIDMSSGSELQPSYTFLSDTDTGMYSSGANQLSFTTGGSRAVYLSGTEAWIYRDFKVNSSSPNIVLRNTDDSLISGQIIGSYSFQKVDGSGAGAGIVGGLRMYSEDSTGGSTYITLSTSNNTTNDNEHMRIDASGNVGIGTSSPGTKLDVDGPIKPKSYTVLTVPSPISPAGALIYVTNESGGAIHCFSDGTNWRRVSDRAIIS